MENTINNYLQYMRQKYGISAAMVAGSYVSGKMGPNSDIDIFMIWPYEYKTKRGREVFEGLEFEFFISPEWKFYDRMRTDPVAVRVYSQSKIVFDPYEKLKRIQSVASNLAQQLHRPLTEQQKRSYLFWLETIRNDGTDLFDQGQYANFAYFASVNLQSLTKLLEKVHNALPVYGKYGAEEINCIDSTYGDLLQQFLLLPPSDPSKRELWVAMCKHLESKLGRLDITTYEVESQL